MLPRSQRLSVEQFNSIIEKGRVAHSSLFLMRFVKDQAGTRIAAAAPKKTAKTAVLRNKIKRQTYEAVGTLVENIVPGVHLVLLAKPTIITAKQTDIVGDLKTLFVKAGLLR